MQVSSKWKRNLSNCHKFHKADKIVKFTSSTNSFKIFCLQHISRQGVFYFLTQDHLRENSSKEYTSLRAIFFNQCPPLKSSPFFCYQLMVSGVSGSRGLNAHDLVAVEYKRELARVIIPAPPMEEVIASVVQTGLGLATVTSAQVESHF